VSTAFLTQGNFQTEQELLAALVDQVFHNVCTSSKEQQGEGRILPKCFVDRNEIVLSQRLGSRCSVERNILFYW
jgi:hypothetical protein